jgi:hypothetical protein
MIRVSKDSRCGLCGVKFGVLEESEAMYVSENPNHHHTCSGCVRKGEKTGLKLIEIMAMTAAAFAARLRRHERDKKNKDVDHQVIFFDPKKKLPKK